METGEMVYQVAALIEEEGQAVSTERITEVMEWDADIFMLEDAEIEGIIFYSTGSRKFATGWYVRRRPRWQEVWLERYGAEHPAIAAGVRARLLPERKGERYVMGMDLTAATEDILRWMAYARLEMERWGYLSKSQEHKKLKRGWSYFDFQYRIVSAAHSQFRRELEYRMQYVVKAERINGLDKGQRALLEDYRQIERLFKIHDEMVFFIKDGEMLLNQHFSEEFVAAYIQQDTLDPTLGDVVPVPAPDKVPTRYLSQRELLIRFFQFVEDAAADKDGFEWDDALTMGRVAAQEAMKENPYLLLRETEFIDGVQKRLARALGEPLEEKPNLIVEEEA
jgi:hypothetical protein